MNAMVDPQPTERQMGVWWGGLPNTSKGSWTFFLYDFGSWENRHVTFVKIFFTDIRTLKFSRTWASNFSFLKTGFHQLHEVIRRVNVETKTCGFNPLHLYGSHWLLTTGQSVLLAEWQEYTCCPPSEVGVATQLTLLMKYVLLWGRCTKEVQDSYPSLPLP